MKIITFDTETINAGKDIGSFDMAFICRDLEKDEIVDTYNAFPKEVLEDEERFKKAYYYGKNKDFYKDQPLTPMQEIKDEFNKFWKRNNPDMISAFMIAFDMRVLNFNFMTYANKKRNTTLKNLSKYVKVIDIPILFALHELFDNDAYSRFCYLNNFITKAGRSKTTAEAVYSYIGTKSDFKEKHTALDDSIIESEIIQYVYNNNDPVRFKALIDEASKLSVQNKKVWFMKNIKL